MRKLHDWKGNEIQEGQFFFEVLVDQRKDFLWSEGQEFTLHGLEGIKHTFIVPKDTEYWSEDRTKKSYSNTETGKTFLTVHTEDGDISILMGETYPPEGHILCIEGVSDSKQEYYKQKSPEK
jgi:hypothetical protein